ncbi:hypothetical protein RQP46_002301 [Phenoliferia psychrophenolica]
MDAFRVLTGGARFKKQDDVRSVFETTPLPSTSQLPASLDFFAPTPSSPSSTVPQQSERAVLKKDKKRKRALEAATTESTDYAAFNRLHRIKFDGLEPPNPVTSIADLQRYETPQVLVDNWAKLGLGAPTPIQMASWGCMLSQRDILACAPTGSGKTFAFLLPLLSLNPPTHATNPTPRPTVIIIEPTRELAMQVYREATRLGEGGGWQVRVLGEEHRKLKVESGKGGNNHKTKGKGKGKGKDKVGEEEEGTVVVAPVVPELPLEGPTDILISTPLGLVFAIKSGRVDATNVQTLILDEADTLWSLNFASQTSEILSACSSPSLRKGMFSATLPSGVEEMAKAVIGPGVIRTIIGHKDAATDTISQSLMFVGTEDSKLLSLRSLIAEGNFTPPVLIFTQSIQRAKELSTELLFDGINADCIHAERTPEERDDVVNKFADGRVWALICTDVMARGVDFANVKLVINYDFPQSAGSYIHRIGRTGRAGKPGKAITFFSKADALHLKSIVNVMRASGCPVPAFMLDLKAPSQDDKKRLLLRPVARKDISRTNGAGSGNKGDRKKVERNRVMGGMLKEREKEAKRKAEGGSKAGGAKSAKKAKREVPMEE